jgi:hypothetical protein
LGGRALDCARRARLHRTCTGVAGAAPSSRTTRISRFRISCDVGPAPHLTPSQSRRLPISTAMPDSEEPQ